MGNLSILCFFLLLFVLFTTSCEENQVVKPKGTSIQSVPANFTYSVINSDIVPGIKRSLDIRLNKKISKSDLRDLAFELKRQDSQRYDRTFICYYLPGMTVDHGAWATTHFNPNLEVRILSFTAEEDKALKKLPDDSSKKVIGIWLDESPFLGSRITIFRRNGKFFLEKVYKDGSSGTKEIVERSSFKGRTFRYKKKSSAGEFYLIDKQGNLQLWDNEGIISTSKSIN